jgi:hypothetical protein
MMRRGDENSTPAAAANSGSAPAFSGTANLGHHPTPPPTEDDVAPSIAEVQPRITYESPLRPKTTCGYWGSTPLVSNRPAAFQASQYSGQGAIFTTFIPRNQGAPRRRYRTPVRETREDSIRSNSDEEMPPLEDPDDSPPDSLVGQLQELERATLSRLSYLTIAINSHTLKIGSLTTEALQLAGGAASRSRQFAGEPASRSLSRILLFKKAAEAASVMASRLRILPKQFKLVEDLIDAVEEMDAVEDRGTPANTQTWVFKQLEKVMALRAATPLPGGCLTELELIERSILAFLHQPSNLKELIVILRFHWNNLRGCLIESL